MERDTARFVDQSFFGGGEGEVQGVRRDKSQFFPVLPKSLFRCPAMERTVDLMLVEYGKPKIQFVLDFRRALRMLEFHFRNKLIEIFVQRLDFSLGCGGIVAWRTSFQMFGRFTGILERWETRCGSGST